jgi:hypothetical protein
VSVSRLRRERLGSRAWASEAVARLEADANRSADTHLHTFRSRRSGASISLIDGRPSPVTAIMRERTLLLLLPHYPFKQLFGREDTIARVFLDVILRDLVSTLRLTLRPHARLLASV